MRLELIKGADAPILTLDETKNWLRVIGDDENALISMLINAAEDYFENYTDRALSPKTYKVIFENERCILPKSPVLSVEAKEDLKIKWDFGVAEILGVDSGEFEFVAGYKIIPQIVKIWALNKIASWYENRENIIIGASATALPKSHIDCVLDQFRYKKF